MNRLSPLALAGAIIATGVTVMASSQVQAATTRVRYADLDLSTASGRATLDGRITVQLVRCAGSRMQTPPTPKPVAAKVSPPPASSWIAPRGTGMSS